MPRPRLLHAARVVAPGGRGFRARFVRSLPLAALGATACWLGLLRAVDSDQEIRRRGPAGGLARRLPVLQSRRMTALPGIVLLALLAAAPTDGKAHLSDFRLSVRGGRVEVSFALINPADDEMLERIQTGLPSGYDFQFRLVRGHRRWWDLRWWDQSLDSATLQVFATYDAVTREYLVNYRLNDRLIQSQVVRELDELRQAMTRFEGLHIFTVEPRPERRRLQVRARAKLGDRNLLGFIPSTRTTDWVESSRFTSPAG